MTDTRLLLHTKLYPPRLPADIVERPHLLARLDAGLTHPLTLISAPAGYGKTTLVSQWLQSVRLPAAWISLDESDNDLGIFLTYVVEAIRTICPHACERTRRALKAPQLPPLPELAASLVNDLHAVDDDAHRNGIPDFLLVLDDYHAVHSLEIDSLLDEVLRHPPHALHLVISTRREPMLRLTQLRAHRALVELRSQDLRFNLEEATRLLGNMLAEPIDPESMALLNAKTEGWAVGLSLAGVSLQKAPDRKKFLVDLHGSQRYIVDYLVDEVLTQQEPAVQRFLIQTAILDRFRADLCRAVIDFPEDETSPMDPDVILRELEKTNLFLVPLDDERTWFRYHQLFRDFLIDHLKRSYPTSQIRSKQSRAAAWFAEHKYYDEALRHLLAAGQTQSAVQLIEAQRIQVLNLEQWGRLERWLDALPAEVIGQYPALLLAQAWTAQSAYKWERLPALVGSAQTQIDAQVLSTKERQILEAEIDILSGLLDYWQNRGHEATEKIGRGLRNTPSSHAYIRGLGLLYLALAMQMIGQKPEAVRMLQNALQSPETVNRAFNLRVLVALGTTDIITADWNAVQGTGKTLLDLAREAKQPVSIAWAHYNLGRAALGQDKLEQAESHFLEVAGMRYSCHTLAYQEALFGLALIYERRGRREEANRTVEQLQNLIVEENLPAELPHLQALQVRLALIRGETAEAVRWARAVNLGKVSRPFFDLESPHLTQTRGLLSSETEEDRARGRILLAELLDAATATHSNRGRIEILAVQALYEQADGNSQQALRTLAKALALAQPGGEKQFFVELGEPLFSLLGQLQKRPENPQPVGALIRAILGARKPNTGEKPFETKTLGPETASGSHAQDYPEFATVLTNREIDVLELLEQRMSNKEIARRLCISPTTVKRHTANLYRKLEVSGRREAVVKARSVGILKN